MLILSTAPCRTQRRPSRPGAGWRKKGSSSPSAAVQNRQSNKVWGSADGGQSSETSAAAGKLRTLANRYHISYISAAKVFPRVLISFGGFLRIGPWGSQSWLQPLFRRLLAGEGSLRFTTTRSDSVAGRGAASKS